MKHTFSFRLPLVLLGIGLLAWTGCKKKSTDDPEPNGGGGASTAAFHINIQHYVGDQRLVLQEETYSNSLGEDYTVSLFNYYLSNFKLLKEDGTEYPIEESYFLVKHSPTENMRHLHLMEVPEGRYTGMRFLIGVDSLRNVSGAQTGALAVDHGMFWTWNTGYIMAKLEGNSPLIPNGGKFMHHIGGFSGENSALHEVTIPFPSTLEVSEGISGDLLLRADLAKWFDGPNTISLVDVPMIMNTSATSARIAENYSHMFSLVHAQVFEE